MKNNGITEGFHTKMEIIPNAYDVRYLFQDRRYGGGTYRNRPGCLVYKPNIMRFWYDPAQSLWVQEFRQLPVAGIVLCG
jgi:hypothetical protein